jgi:UDP-2,4-diacetamido-2,4,6-trideoxy-beta-L-altropyranose hydrolase
VRKADGLGTRLGTLLLRADASVAMGTGHVMRCLALAQAWQDAGGTATFAMAGTTPAVTSRLHHENAETKSISARAGSNEDAQALTELARHVHADWIVVDGYLFEADYQQALKSAGFKILFLDDYGHAKHYFADVILNQNVSAKADIYSEREQTTRLLLGTRYCLLRRDFSARSDWKRKIEPICRRVLVMMGGSDPENLTARIIEALALASIEGLEAKIVVGGSNPNFTTVEKAAFDSGFNINVLRDVSNPADLMAEADIAISAAGSTCWELCMLGLPALLIDVADNQTALAQELDRMGCAIHIGDRSISSSVVAEKLHQLANDQHRRQNLSQCSRRLVDGRGAARVVSTLSGAPGLKLRPARPEDRHLLWEWANDPEVRAASFSPDPISWDTHVAWFEEKLRNETDFGTKKSFMLIAEDECELPIGQIRFDWRLDGSWEVGVSIAREMRGRGIGRELIRLGVQQLRKQVILPQDSNAPIHALVKPANTASVNAFELAGFTKIGTDLVRGCEAIHLVCEI